MILLPLLYPEKVSDGIKSMTNSTLNSKIDFTKSGLSFFRHFPNLTFTLYDFSLMGSAPYDQDTLASGKELSLGINLASFFDESFEVNKLFFDQTVFKILTNKEGKTNYDIMFSTDSVIATDTTASESRLKIQGITLTNCRFYYQDDSFPMKIEIGKLDYNGSGNFINNRFKLESGIFAENVSFTYDNTTYLNEKDIKGMLVTEIDIKTYQIDLIQNELMINELPLNFDGSTRLLDDGYTIDFSLNSGPTDLKNVFTLIPPEYKSWFTSTAFAGLAETHLEFKGRSGSDGTAPDLRFTFVITDGKIQHQGAPFPLDNIMLNSELIIPALNFDRLFFQMKPLTFELKNEQTFVNFSAQGLEAPLLNLKLESQLDLAMLTSALGLKDVQLAGYLNTTTLAKGKYDTENQIIPIINGTLQLKDGILLMPYYPKPIENIQIDMALVSTGNTMSDLSFEVKPISFLFEDEAFTFSSSLREFGDLRFDIEVDGVLNLGKIYQVFALEGMSISGWLKAKASLHGRQSDAENGRYQNLRNSGNIDLKDFTLISSDYPSPFFIPEASLRIENDKAWMKNMDFIYKENRLQLSGYLQDFIGYTLLNKDLKGNMELKSDRIMVDDFMTVSATQTDTTIPSTGIVLFPSDLDLRLNAKIKEVFYDQLNINDLTGSVLLQKGNLYLKQLTFGLAGAKLDLNASYTPVNQQKANFTFSVKADSFDVKRAYNEIPLFRELASAAANAEGLVSMDYVLSGSLNEKMVAVYPSLTGSGYIRLEKVKIKGLKLFSAVGKAVGRDSISDPDLKAVMIRSSIANNIITLEKTKMKVFGFRPSFYGQTSFDGKLNLHFRLGLPPLGLVGIPMTITGTSDHPIVKVRKEKDSDKLVETNDTDE